MSDELHLDSSADEADAIDGDLEEAGVPDEEGEGSEKKKRGRRRRTAADLNLLSDPTDVIIELTESVLQELAGPRKKVHALRYPTYIVLTHPNFKLRSVEGLQAVKGTSLKELDLSNNKLSVLDNLEQFSTLKTLKASHNLIAEVCWPSHIHTLSLHTTTKLIFCKAGFPLCSTQVTIEKLPRLKYLDLSHNKLGGIPDLSGFKVIEQLQFGMWVASAVLCVVGKSATAHLK